MNFGKKTFSASSQPAAGGSLLPHSPRTNQGSPKTTPFGVISQFLRRAFGSPLLELCFRDDTLAPSDSIKSNFQEYNSTSPAQAGSTFTPSDGLRHKSTVYGLNGLRPACGGFPPFKSSATARSCSYGLFPRAALLCFAFG